MKFVALLLATLASSTTGFVVAPSSTQIVASSSSSTALFGSRRRQKVERLTSWLEKRGVSDSSSGAAVATTKPAGLMKNEQGLEYVQLVHPKTGASSQIYLYGACVTSYEDADGIEYIAVRPDAKMDGSKPISGGLSHCWPQFGPGAIQQHGFARNVNWKVDSSSMTDTSVEFWLEPSDYTKAMWDKEFLCRFKVEVQEDQLLTHMIVENKGSADSFDFQAALHSYFTISSLNNLQITGSFAGKEFLNKMAGNGGEMQTETRDAITISEEYDRVYKGVNDPVLKDSGKGKSLQVLNKQGWEDTVLWNPYGNEGMGYNNFVCVESVKFDPVTLPAGGKWVGEMALKPAAL